MKLFQHIISSNYLKSQSTYVMKTVIRDSSYAIAVSGQKKCFDYHFLPKLPAVMVSSLHKFHTIQCLKNNELSVPPTRKRLQRKKVKKDQSNEMYSAVAYSSAEHYKLQDLAKAIKDMGVYKCKSLPQDAGDVLHFSNEKEIKELSHIYFFNEGSVVFWNVPKTEQIKILSFIKPYETNSYDAELITEEREDLDFTYSEEETSFFDGAIVLNSSTDANLYTYTFSNSLALSVKLGVLESALEKFCDSIEWVTEKMKRGEPIGMSRNEILVKRGELFALRHVINFGSDFLDTPDFYWDRKDLEILYKKTCNYLDIAKRTKTMNERLSYCSELIDLLGNHMNDQHHVRLEWMIIILIMVEVVFECMHFLERFSH